MNNLEWRKHAEQYRSNQRDTYRNRTPSLVHSPEDRHHATTGVARQINSHYTTTTQHIDIERFKKQR